MESCGLSSHRLRQYLVHHNAFPATYRPLIWRHLLSLPDNRTAYTAFVAHGIHPSLAGFRDTFPIRDPALAETTHRVLSALAHWSPLFAGNVDYLPHLVFPLVKAMGKDPVAAQELVVVVLLNYAQKWWEYFPNPPLEALEFVDDLLARFDPQLHAHLHGTAGAPAHVYAWPMMQTLMSEALGKDDWGQVWDHIILATVMGPLPPTGLVPDTSSSTKRKSGRSRSPMTIYGARSRSPIVGGTGNNSRNMRSPTSPSSATSTATPTKRPIPPPTYLYLALVAYLRHFRAPIMYLRRPADVREWITTPRPCPAGFIVVTMHAMARELIAADPGARTGARRVASTTSKDHLHVQVGLTGSAPTAADLAHEARGMFDPFIQLPRPSTAAAGSPTSSTAAHATAAAYPPLTGFPHAIVHYATALHARLQADEAATLRARRAAHELAALRADLAADADAWRTADRRHGAASRAWWDSVLAAEAASWERARAARASLRSVHAEAMRAVAAARAGFVAETGAREDRAARDAARAVARARAVAEARDRDAAMDEDLEEVRQEWDTRWRELKRAREEWAQVERERDAKVVEVVSHLGAAAPATSPTRSPSLGGHGDDQEQRLPWEQKRASPRSGNAVRD
ncbi:hypothetical protein BC828DRAFT_406487 [Blastocladiella britannica]|nr:hypothetical protein BC828DRAFT_406487 [Blastocladiella britannica]